MLLVLLLAFGVYTASGAGTATLRVESMSGGGIAVGDKFWVHITLKNTGAPDLESLDLPGAHLFNVNNWSSMSSTTIVNGQRSSNSQYETTATFVADKEGTYTFGPITIGGARTNQIRYTIGKAGSSSSASADPYAPGSSKITTDPTYLGKGSTDLFLKASISKTTAYEQEALVYTIKIYTTYRSVKFIGATAAPKFDGFVVEESKNVDTQVAIENVGGKAYKTAIIARYIIFPQMKGKLTVTGNDYTISVDREELYNIPYYGQVSIGQPEQLTVKPNDLTVNVRELPSPRPADFSGGVGKFQISSSLPNANLKTNETASIVYTITGTGNLKYIHLQDLQDVFPPEIEIYSPATDIKTNVSASNVSGTARFDYSIMPTEEGDFTIPDVTLIYFNPETGQYEKAIAKGYKVHVGKGNASAKSQRKKNLRFENELEEVGTLSHEHTPYVRTFLYWLIYIVSFLLLLGSFVLYRKRLAERADFGAFMSRRANKMAHRRLRKAAAAMKVGNSEKFYDEMLSALWGYLGHKLKMPMSELNRDNATEVLTNAGIDDATIKLFIDLLDECEFAKYSSNSGSQTMESVYENGVNVINKLEESFKHDKSI